MKDFIGFMIKMEGQGHKADLKDINTLITIWDIYSGLPLSSYDVFPPNYQIYMMYADLKYIIKYYNRTNNLPFIKYGFKDGMSVAKRWRVWKEKQKDMEQDLEKLGEVVNEVGLTAINVGRRTKIYLKAIAAELGISQVRAVTYIITNFDLYKHLLPPPSPRKKHSGKKYNKPGIDWTNKEQVKRYRRELNKNKNINELR